MPSDRRAVVVTYPYRHIIREAMSLAQSAGFETLKIITQKHQNSALARERQKN